jgi:hypothetical protein
VRLFEADPRSRATCPSDLRVGTFRAGNTAPGRYRTPAGFFKFAINGRLQPSERSCCAAAPIDWPSIRRCRSMSGQTSASFRRGRRGGPHIALVRHRLSRDARMRHRAF